MKRLFLFVGLILGMLASGNVQAAGYFTFSSTGIAFSSTTSFDLLAVFVSTVGGATGNGAGAQSLVVIDSAALSLNHQTGGAFDRNPGDGQDILVSSAALNWPGPWTADQLILPPIPIVYSTTTATASNFGTPLVDLIKYDGLRVKNGLVVLIINGGLDKYFITIVTENLQRRREWGR